MRGWIALPFALLFAFPVAAGVGLWAALFPRHFRPRMKGTIQFWGRMLLRLLGVRLIEEGRENLAGGGQILMTNHVSVFDLLIYASIWPEGGTVIYKQEFHRIPIIGRTMRALGFIAIDRSNRAAGKASLERAAQRVREDGATIMIAPEGTRSRHGRLLPFKKGPFHLALATRAPVVVGIMQGVEQVSPDGSWVARPGTVRVRFLPPVPTEDWSSSQLNEHMNQVRGLFLEHLEEDRPRAPASDSPTPETSQAN